MRWLRSRLVIDWSDDHPSKRIAQLNGILDEPGTTDGESVARGGAAAVAPDEDWDAESIAQARADDEDRDATQRMFSLVRHGRYADVERRLQDNFSPDAPSADGYNNSLMMIAAQNGSKRMVKLLFRFGADPNRRNVRDETALHFAFRLGYFELGDYMIRKMRAQDDIPDCTGATAASLRPD